MENGAKRSWVKEDVFGSIKFCCGWVKEKVSWLHWMRVNNVTEDNIVIDEVLVEGLGWEMYVARCLHSIHSIEESHFGK